MAVRLQWRAARRNRTGPVPRSDNECVAAMRSGLVHGKSLQATSNGSRRTPTVHAAAHTHVLFRQDNGSGCRCGSSRRVAYGDHQTSLTRSAPCLSRPCQRASTSTPSRVSHTLARTIGRLTLVREDAEQVERRKRTMKNAFARPRAQQTTNKQTQATVNGLGSKRKANSTRIP